ncbi:MAG: O-antigen translocase [bacterium]
MSINSSSYRQIFKATSLFGGVQFFTIIASIVRSKVIAILLGPEGMGIQGLLTTAINLIGGITNFGLRTSAVKNVAAVNKTEDFKEVSKIVVILRRLVWITGLFGALVSIIFSAQISNITFGNKDHTLAFVWISLALVFNQLTAGETVVLQRMRRLKDLARSGLFGAILGLVVSLPVYYFFGFDGIVPAIILISVSNFLRTWFFSRKINFLQVKVSRNATIEVGKDMITMGFMLSLSSLFVLAKEYGIRAYIGIEGGVNQVGLYTAGFAIINTYVGMIFNAMTTDYYPRLSLVADNNGEMRSLINQQAEIAVLIIAPVLMAFIVFIGWVIVILYSSEFITTNVMLQFAAIGMLFKTISWSIAFSFLAKGASKTYLINEFVGGAMTFSLHLLGYYLWGLTGAGIGFLIGYIYYSIQVFFLTKKLYDFSFSKSLVHIFILQLGLSTIAFILAYKLSSPFSYIFGVLVIIISGVISFKGLDERIGIVQLYKKYKNKKKQ